jgi:hypothetical protein
MNKFTSSPSFDPLDASEHTEATVDSVDSSDNSSSSSTGRRVAFGVIHVREYERIVGDHPDCRVGVPLSIGWAYNQKEGMPVDQYETHRVKKGNLRMSSITRKNLLRNVFGISDEELRDAEKEVQRIRKSREHSMKQSAVVAKTESAVKSFRKRLGRVLTVDKLVSGLAAASSSMMLPGIHSY